MHVRPAHPSDACEIAGVHVRAWQAAYRGIMPDAFLDGLSAANQETAWEKRLAGDLEVMLLLEVEGTVAGWAVAGRSRHPESTPDTAELYAINLDPTVWRRGAGRMLCASVHEALRLRGYARVTLWVLEDNIRARAFYAVLGYREDPALAQSREFGGVALRELCCVMEL